MKLKEESKMLFHQREVKVMQFTNVMETKLEKYLCQSNTNFTVENYFMKISFRVSAGFSFLQRKCLPTEKHEKFSKTKYSAKTFSEL